MNKRMLEYYTQKLSFNTNLWILPYANLMTIVMIFFLVLFVMANRSDQVQYESMLVDLERSMGTRVSERQNFVTAATEMNDFIASRGLQKIANVQMNAQHIRIIMSAPVLFTSGSADLSPDAQPLLDQLTAILQKIPNRVTIEGHTDDIPLAPGGKFRSNLELSGARAFNVIRYFIEKGSMDPARFSALGCGENIPLKPNDSPENRALNRRVEISIEKR